MLRAAALSLTLLVFPTLARAEAASALADRPSQPATPELAFWIWFVAHQNEVATIRTGGEPIADRLAEQLHKIHPDLTFELSTDATPHELIVSADGLKDAFPAVQKLVAASPQIPGWKVTAFRPRRQGGTIKVDDGTVMRSERLHFIATPAEAGKLDVALYVDSAAAITPSVQKCVYLLLDATLGEYDVETRMAGIDILVGPAPASARPFRALPAAIDALKAK